MRNFLLLIAITFITVNTQAQWLPNGSVIDNFQMTDINNNTIDAYQTTALGKHIIIDFSATWCGNCINYHNSHVLEDYYQAYGPNGTIAQDAQVVFYEADFTTTYNDLIGTGSNTIADWTQGVSYPICNEATPSDVYHKFLATPGNIGYPSVVVLCANNTFYKLNTNITDETMLRNIIQSNCAAAPLQLDSKLVSKVGVSIIPNPSYGNFTINFSSETMKNIPYKINDITGKTIYKGEFTNIAVGENTPQVSLFDYTSGMYIISFILDDTPKTLKLILK